MYDTPSTYRNSYLKQTPVKSGQDAPTPPKSSRLIPMWVQIVFFLFVAIFLYMVFSNMETNESFKGLEWFFFFFFLKLYSVCRCVTVYFKFILIWGMYFGQWLYFRHCWNCEWCNICVRYNSSLFACLWVKCITFTRLQYNTTTRIDEDATLKGLKNTQNHSVTWTAAVYLYRWFQCDLMRFWMTWEDHTLTIKKKVKKKKICTYNNWQPISYNFTSAQTH